MWYAGILQYLNFFNKFCLYKILQYKNAHRSHNSLKNKTIVKNDLQTQIIFLGTIKFHNKLI